VKTGSASAASAGLKFQIGRRSIRVCDLADPAALEVEVANVQARNRLIKDSTLDWQLFDQLVMRAKNGALDRGCFVVTASANASGRHILFGGPGHASDRPRQLPVCDLVQFDDRRVHRSGCERR
jgi:hypothetical protein